VRVVQIAPSIEPGSGVGGVAFHLEEELARQGVSMHRFTMREARGAWLPEPGPGVAGKLLLLVRVGWFTVVGTLLARRMLRADPTLVAICHNDVLAGDVYVNHGILQAAMRARGNFAVRMLRNPLHLFTTLRDRWRYTHAVHRVVVNLTSGEAETLRATYAPFVPETVVIGNGVDTDRFRPATPADRSRARTELGLDSADPHKRYLLFVGHEYDRKGLPLILRALPSLGENVELIVVGGTSDMISAAAASADRLHVVHRVHFLGTLADPVLAYRAADCFILPSSYEANALVVLEALASGIPVIATPVGFAPDVVTDGVNGFIIDRDEAGVADGINRWQASEGLDLGHKARQSAERYSWQRIADQYQSLLLSLSKPETRWSGTER
jgi:glycosyltransferase involved in cell wall biosynthesis